MCSNTLVEVEELGEESAGGIIIPEVARQNHDQLCTIGKLVAMGPGTDLSFYRNGEAIQVKHDMLPLKVVYTRWGGTPMRLGKGKDTKNYRLLTDRDTPAVLFGEVETPRTV